ncbi:uncharacterized protein LOC144639505 [Oculina patagonica]
MAHAPTIGSPSYGGLTSKIKASQQQGGRKYEKLKTKKINGALNTAFSPVFTAFLIVACISPMRASVVRTSDSELRETTEVFNLHITERGTNFVERVEIDESNDIEYFTVPAHNDVLGADYLYDFRMNITLTRFKEDEENRGLCFLTPLPSALPKPSLLKMGLREVTALPGNQQIKAIAHKWKVYGKVDKTTLRGEVRDFCAQYPVYRLMEYTPDSFAIERPGERTKRQLNFDELEVCGTGHPGCNYKKWKLRCKFTIHSCVFYVRCWPNNVAKRYECAKHPVHESGRVMCCDATCPQ